MKKQIVSVLCALMALPLSVTAFAAAPVESYFSPATAAFTDSAPGAEYELQPGYALRIDGKETGVRVCIMVPLRNVAEKLGFTVSWSGDGTILLDDGMMHSTVAIGEDLYQVTTSSPDLVGMSAPFSLGVPPCTVNGATYVPLGLFDALLGSQQGAVTMEDGAICLHTYPMDKHSSMQLPNPFVEHETLEQAIQAAGFELDCPDTVNGSDRCVFRAIENDLLEVIYHRNGDETARIRKAPGSGDISGDYNAYQQVRTVSVHDLKVVISGSDDKVSLATWTNDGYTYAVSITGSISDSDMAALVSAIR